MQRTPHSLFTPGRVAAAIALASILLVGYDALHLHGIVGTTPKNGFGCNCHGLDPAPGVSVRIEGPPRVVAGASAPFTIVVTGGPAVRGGFNVAAGRGGLAPGDAGSKLLGTELTHTTAKAFVADTVRWTFLYQAPADTTLDTLFCDANSANGDGTPGGDAWNNGANFIVDLVPDSATAVGEPPLPLAAALVENYPNPFNPSTTIRVAVEREGRAELAVFDARGARVATLFTGRLGAGMREVRWDAAGMPSGVYLARLAGPERSVVHKMLLLR